MVLLQKIYCVLYIYYICIYLYDFDLEPKMIIFDNNLNVIKSPKFVFKLICFIPTVLLAGWFNILLTFKTNITVDVRLCLDFVMESFINITLPPFGILVNGHIWWNFTLHLFHRSLGICARDWLVDWLFDLIDSTRYVHHIVLLQRSQRFQHCIVL